MSTTAGAGSLVIGLTLIVLGGLLWFQPIIRFFAGCVAVFLGVLSLPISNFGGFFVGTLLAAAGGLLALAWGPVDGDGHAEGIPDGTEEPSAAAIRAGGQGVSDQLPDTQGEAAEPRFARPPRGRHAIPVHPR